ALAERPADSLPLALHFLGQGLQLSEDAAAALQAHDWPGNVRELRNSIERAKLLARERSVAAADLNLPAVSRAAQSLGLSRQALYRRMERFNLRPLGGA